MVKIATVTVSKYIKRKERKKNAVFCAAAVKKSAPGCTKLGTTHSVYIVTAMYITLKSPVSVLNTYLSYGCQPGVQQNFKVAKTIVLNSCHIPKLSCGCTSIPALSAWLQLCRSPETPESCLPQKDPIPTEDKQTAMHRWSQPKEMQPF